MEIQKSYYEQLVELFNFEVLLLTITSSLWVFLNLGAVGDWTYYAFFLIPAILNLLYYIMAKINFKKDINDIPKITNIIPIVANFFNISMATALTIMSLPGFLGNVAIITILLNTGFYIAYIRRIILLHKEKKQMQLAQNE